MEKPMPKIRPPHVTASLAACFALCASLAAQQAAPGLQPGGRFTPPTIPQPSFPGRTFDVKSFGATGDGQTNDTAAVSKAIEQASAAGGGTVTFPRGKYMLASARIRSNVRLLLDKDAVLEGLKLGYDAPEPNPEFDKYQDFGHSHFRNSVLWGENVENFAIVGGKVNGGGAITGDPKRPTTQPDGTPGWGGDKVVTIKVGKNLLFKDVTHDTGAHFVYLLNDCQNITVDNVVIKKSRDAIDFMGCRNVAVSNCNFTGCGDDTIGFKSDYALGRRINSENFYVWNNYFESGCNGLQFGSETAGDFKNIQCWDITINQGMKSGIGITSNDSAVIEDVHYKDIKIANAAVPIFVLVTDRLRTGEPGAKVGKIRNVTFQNITVTDVVAGKHHGPAAAATISGRPDSVIENVTLDNVKITYKGGDKQDEASVTPPYPKEKYSPNGMGPRPASGFYVRHAKGLTFRNVEVAYETPTVKPPLVFFDVHGLLLDRLKIQKPARTETIRLENVTGLELRDCDGLQSETVAQVDKATR
jgi:polygalacturonase